MTPSKERPFKKVYCDRPEVFLLPPAAFKTWMYHYIREGVSRESWPSLQTICEDLDMNEKTVKQARKFLKDNGWLKQVGSKISKESGKFKVPVMQVTRGSIPPKAEKRPTVKKRGLGPKNGLWTGAEKRPMDRGRKTATEVEPQRQVDSNNQVDCLPTLSPEGKGNLNVAGGLGKIQEPGAEKRPTVNGPDLSAKQFRYRQLSRKQDISQAEVQEYQRLKAELFPANV
jgi:hypothetical protein